MSIRVVNWMLSFSPCARISEVSPREALDCALYVMYRWGYIRCFRFDNGRPFGDPRRENITPCALNLIARGCEVKFNSPRRPTQNAKVERCQGTTGRWADAKRSADIDEFQENLEYAVIAQRERLPTRVCQGITRAQCYPGLFKNPRRYNPCDFDLRRVFQHLAKGKWHRKISKVGQLEMFAERYQVGYAHRRKSVSVVLKMEGQKPYWYCSDKTQTFLAKVYAKNIANGNYLNLSNKSKN